ncbi:outer membrane beta-barrel family protein [Arenibacter sp. F20364]|uniref:outer membrane beta-barrel family protein n=1 Tax=Arenibacter sp. F20364 TaxID=2926415 RepID=UPI001FF42B85|nr:outer membrane beta-barrel family protein [Arenibacter sp. F20364]MCK0189712.1 TonB-dependent receptor [Arenibacter sp. F20364]
MPLFVTMLKVSTLFFLLVCIPLVGQEYKVSGHVKQTDGAELAFANILLYKVSDTSFFKGAASDEKGFFSFDNIIGNQYLVRASYIGSYSNYKLVEVNSDLDIGPLFIDDKGQELNEVVVVSQKPTLEQKVDRLVFNIENTALSDSDLWDVLKSTPTVFVMNDEIKVKGESGVQIMINDKKVNLPPEDILNLLSGTSAKGVQSIEVITTPPAKYDAEGGTLINIKMKKNLIAGYNGAIYNRYSQGVFPRQMLGTSHYFKGRRLEASFNYSFTQNKFLTTYTDITNFIEDSQIIDIWTSDLEVIYRSKKHNTSAFLDYVINDNNTLSFSSIATFTPSYLTRDFSDTKIQDANSSETSGFYTENNAKFKSVNSAFYLDYVHKFNDSGSRLGLNSHYTHYAYDKNQALETDFYDGNGVTVGENDFNTYNKQHTHLYSVQADYSTPLGNNANFESGIKYALIDSESYIAQEGFDRNQEGIEPTEDGTFFYDEEIYSGYASFDAKWNNWTMKSGLRAEYTETKGDFSNSTDKIKNRYLELFPTLFFQYNPNRKHRFGASYKRSIIRPSYNKINPFQVFQSNNSVVEGNVNLQPSFKNSVILSYTYNKDYTFELFYRYHRNIIRLLTFQDNESKFLRFISDNIDRELAYGLDFIYRKDIANFWDTYFLSSYYYGTERFTDILSQQTLDQGLWTLLLQFNNNFTMLEDKSLTASLNYTYVSPIVLGNSRQEYYNEWGISIKKNIWGKKASVTMGLTDIFKQFKLKNTRKYGNQDNISIYRPNGRIFSVGFRYNFGNMKIRDNYKSKDTDERDRL